MFQWFWPFGHLKSRGSDPLSGPDGGASGGGGPGRQPRRGAGRSPAKKILTILASKRPFCLVFERGAMLYRMPRNADARMHSWLSEGTVCGVLLLLLPLQLLLVCQLPCNRAPGTQKRRTSTRIANMATPIALQDSAPPLVAKLVVATASCSALQKSSLRCCSGCRPTWRCSSMQMPPRRRDCSALPSTAKIPALMPDVTF